MKINLLIPAIFFTISVTAQTPPAASFSVNKTSGCTPLEVEFINTSANAISYLWDFGNGDTSSLANPSVIYFNAGSYTVTLVAFSSAGQSDTLTLNNLVEVTERPVAAFTVVNNQGCANGSPVIFTNNSSNATGWIWDFGDGVTSSQQNPSHIYTVPGAYSVALIAQNASGCADVKLLSQYVIISARPSADFFADTTKYCSLDHQFVFTPVAANAGNYTWNFHDGASSSQQSPSHVYSAAGKYSVTLSVTGQNGCGNALTKSNYITVSQELNPVFSAANNAGCTPLNVNFNSSLSSSLAYLWNFGDGSPVSSAPDPSHVYSDTGIYDVSLTVTDAHSCSFSYTAADLVNTTDPLKANFTASAVNGCSPLTVNFTDNSINAANWSWDFGDGGTSALKNPSHKYQAPGTYTVALIVHNAGNCKSVVLKPGMITVTGPVSAFSASDTTGCTPLAVSFTDSSSGAMQWSWDFGDGTGSSLRNPVHTYTADGFYTVKLITYSNTGCTDTLVKSNFIRAFDPDISFNAVDTVSSCNEISASFNGSSIGTGFWLWNFGDGAPASSAPNPSHTYNAPGIYTVSLTTQTANGCTITLNNYNVFEIYEAEVDFSYSFDTCSDLTASFSNSSAGAVSWYWSFGDGTFSTGQNPTHTYPEAGLFSVALNVSTANGCTYSTMKNNIIYFSCENNGGGSDGGGGAGGGGNSGGGSGGSDSTGSASQVTGCAPFSAYFSNPFDSAVSFLWYFGDGDSSTLENPTHIYSSQGIFDVALIVTYPDNSTGSLIRNDFIKVNKPEAVFSSQQDNNCENSTIVLANASLNSSEQDWDFGDGHHSTVQNPVHTYSESGNYLVTLKSSDDYGCSSVSVKNIYAGVTIPVFNIAENACIHDSAAFLSNMVNYDSYLWDFGDGDFSTEESPVHVFDSAGTFLVSLTVYDSLGCAFTNIFPGEINVSNPVADFSISNNSGCNTLMASFNDLSADAESWSWNFGDGTSTSSVPDPVHIYSAPGTYPVTLTVEKNGCTAQKTIPSAVTVHESMAGFSFVQNTLCFPVTAVFTDSSQNAVSWWWNFGDGSTDSVQNPVHVFNDSPSGNISLTITDLNGCTASVSKTNIDEFVPVISASSVQGCETLQVNFTDQSNGAVSWEWHFGDGSVSTLQNPSHFYSDSGSYTVTLIAESQDGCKDTVVYPDYINVYKVIAGFSSPSVLSGCNPLLVNFLDNSVNADHWSWNFGDGSSSAQKNPWHIYTVPGINDITLIVSNDFGCSDTIVKSNFLNVSGPVASFSVSPAEGCVPVQVQFVNTSVNTTGSLTWYFGDGTTSSALNPTHVYDSTGNFTVSLLAEDTTGCSSFYTFPQNITVNPAPSSSFTNFITSGCQPVTVFFDGKLQHTDSAYWNFGDGSFSHSPAGTHTFNSAGVYHPVLISSNNYGCMDTFYYPPVTVYPVPVADFTSKNNKGCSPLQVNFTNNSENLDNASFQWNFGNGEAASEMNPAAIYDVGGLYDVSLIVTNGSGCSDTVTKNNFVQAYDNFSPPSSDVVVATVSSNTSVLVVWKESQAVDFEKYILYRKNSQAGQFMQIASFSDLDVTSYTDENLNTLHNSYCYKLQTVDFCGNSKNVDELIGYCTINVTARPDSSKISVTWTPYTGCSVGSYEILRARDRENFNLIASVDAGTLNYEDTAWHCFTEYSYKIKALDICGNPISSFSDTSAAKADENILARQQVEVVRSTVIDNSAVFTEWKSPEFAPEKVAGYKIYRSPGNLKFELAGILPASMNSFTDTYVDVSKQNYYYKVETVNVCEVKSALSNNASSVLLQAERAGYDVKLKWTPYKNWENGVEHYIIERMDENGNWQVVKIVDGNITEFKDALIK